MTKIKEAKDEIEEMMLQLVVLSARLEDPGLFPCTYTIVLNHIHL